MDNVKPCPFCSSKRLTYDCSYVGTSMRIRCRSCDALGPWVFKSASDKTDLAQECIERWNHRTSSDGFSKIENIDYGVNSDDKIRHARSFERTGEPQVRTYRPSVSSEDNRRRSIWSR